MQMQTLFRGWTTRRGAAERGRYGKNQPIRYGVCPRAAYADEQHSEAIELKRLAGDRVFKTEYDTIILLCSKRP